MADRYYKKSLATPESYLVKLHGSVVTSTSGTISTTSCIGFSIAKTAAKTGRYTVTLEDYFVGGLKACNVTVIGSADTVYTSAKGLQCFLRNVSVSGTAKTFDIQFCDRQTAPADAELENAAQFLIEITVKNSSQTY